MLRNVTQAAVLCGLGASVDPLPAAPAKARSGSKICIATLGFADRTNAALAKELTAAGIRNVQP